MAHISKWQKIVNELSKTPGVEKLVAEDAPPSAATRLRQLGATVRAVATAPRGTASYGRYDLYVMVEGDAAKLAQLDDDEQRNALMITAYDREMEELDRKLEANSKARTKLLTKRRAAQYMKSQLLDAQDALKLRRQTLDKGDQDG